MAYARCRARLLRGRGKAILGVSGRRRIRWRGGFDHAIRASHDQGGPDGGGPCLRGLRIPVATVVGMVAEGMTHKDILDACPDLEDEDIAEALRYAAEAVRERCIPLETVS